MSFTQEEARVFVKDARASFASLVEEDIRGLEDRLYAVMNGPCEIPRQGSPLSDVWDGLVNLCGSGLSNFTVRGERLFVKSRRGGAVGGLGTAASAVGVLVDTLDGLLDRWDPGSVNVNDAAEEFGKVLATVIGLRARRGAILRDGIDRAGAVASSELEQVALTGGFEAAVAELVGLHLETSCANEDPGRSWSSMSLEEQESVIGLVPDEPIDASTLKGRWEQYELLIADLQARRDAEVVAVLAGSTLRAVGADLGVSHVMVAKIAARGRRRVLVGS